MTDDSGTLGETHPAREDSAPPIGIDMNVCRETLAFNRTSREIRRFRFCHVPRAP